MTRKLLAGLLLSAAASLWMGGAARADTTITISSNGAACKVPAPADVAAPVTPSAAAGREAAKNNNFALARANFRPLAEAGNAEAERLYGVLLMQNCTGIQDKEVAATWFAKAADAGDVEAQQQLGAAYLDGEGVAQDDAKAFALMSKAAAANNVNAEASLGYLYLSGRGVAADPYQGIVWSARAGEQGNPVALNNIGNAYFKGAALPQNTRLAAFYTVAALGRATGARRGHYAQNLSAISRQMSADDLKEVTKDVQGWSPGPNSLAKVVADARIQHNRASW